MDRNSSGDFWLLYGVEGAECRRGTGTVVVIVGCYMACSE